MRQCFGARFSHHTGGGSRSKVEVKSFSAKKAHELLLREEDSGRAQDSSSYKTFANESLSEVSTHYRVYTFFLVFYGFVNGI